MKLSSSASEQEEDDGDEGEEVEPGKMRVSEIKAELDLRGISYNDCFDKDSLEQKLVEARKSGKADPELLEKFNKQRVCISYIFLFFFFKTHAYCGIF